MRLHTREAMRVFTRFEETASTDESNAFLSKLAQSHVLEVKHSASREYLLACLANNDILGLCNFDPPYEQLTASDARAIRQACAFFQKRQDIDLGIDRQLAATKKFLEAEALCSETNKIFRLWSRGRFQFTPRVEAVLHAAQRKIAAILGPVPSPGELKFRFGPGATTTRKKKWAHPLYKISDEITCSEDLLPVCDVFLRELPQWCRAHAKSESDSSFMVDVRSAIGRVDFVPKNWKTDRSIVVEPSLNTLCQLGIGEWIAKRLRLSGIDITDQTRNQKMARYGSLTGRVATFDLSSASDTIALELVAHLLPPDWFELLVFTRTGTVELHGKVIHQEKFSSMGNGYTFPLETLIFYALAYACCEGEELDAVSVYGDDIIIPVHGARLLMETLHACGFLLNRSKSYWYGGFRESCGKDYHMGTEIRPFYQKGACSGQSLFSLYNFYYRNYDERSRIVLRHLCPEELRIFGPDGYGDGHLLHAGWSSFAAEKPKGDGYGGDRKSVV